MKQLTLYILLIFSFTQLKAENKEFFSVSLLGIRVAEVEISTISEDSRLTETAFHAYTVGAFHSMYHIDNFYHFYTDPQIDSLHYYYKRIHQKEFKQYYSETVRRDTLIYHKNREKIPVKKPVHHLLSFLIYLQAHPHICSGKNPLPDMLISDEGKLFKPAVHILRNDKKQQYEVYFMLSSVGGRELLPNTDIFNWKVCQGSAKRMAAYSYTDNSLTEAAFALGLGINLKAKRIGE